MQSVKEFFQNMAEGLPVNPFTVALVLVFILIFVFGTTGCSTLHQTEPTPRDAERICNGTNLGEYDYRDDDRYVSIRCSD